MRGRVEVYEGVTMRDGRLRAQVPEMPAFWDPEID